MLLPVVALLGFLPTKALGAPAPTLDALLPDALNLGQTADIYLGGSNFQQGAVGLCCDQPSSSIPLEFISSSLLKAPNTYVSPTASTGTYTIQVKNPDGQISNGIPLVIQQGPNNAQFISQDVPSTMIAGELYLVHIVMHNTGNSSWIKGTTYKLGSQNPQDNTLWGSARVDLPSTVAPNTRATFSFIITAPSSPGTYHFQWRMVQEHLEWFGDLTPNIAVHVQAPPPGPPSANVQVNMNQLRQTIQGLGGDFTKWITDEIFYPPPPLSVDHTTLLNIGGLRPYTLRAGIPARLWQPTNGGPFVTNDPYIMNYLETLQDFQQDLGIHILFGLADVPNWMVSDPSQSSQRLIPSNLYAAAADYIVSFLAYARTNYGINVDYFCFNEPDSGVLLSFSPSDFAAFIKTLGARMAAAGLPTKLIGPDTAVPNVGYVTPLVQDPQIRSYLGGISFHPYGTLEGHPVDTSMENIYTLAQQYGLPVWCTECNYGAYYHGGPTAESWSNAWLQGNILYRVLRHGHASGIIDYPYNGSDLRGSPLMPYPVYYVYKQFGDGFVPGSQVVETSADSPAIWPMAAQHAAQDKFSLLLINTAATPQTISTTIRGLPNTDLTLQRNSATEQLVTVGVYHPQNGTVTLSLPAKSINLLSGRLTVQTPTDTTPPTVSITAPAHGATVSGTITVTASASDNVGVSKVEFSVDGVLKGTDTTSPYSYAWNTTSVANGSHTLLATASDAAGNVGQSSSVLVSVSNATLRGDLNGDGQRTLTDVRWLIEMLVGLRPKNLSTADLTGDGRLTLADVQTLIRWLVGLP